MVRTRQWACVLALAATGVCSVGVAWRSALNRGVALDQASAVLAATSLELLPGHTPDYNNDEESDDDAHFNYGDDSTLGSGGRAKMALHMIPTDLYPYAVCNDGSGAGFYYRQGGSDDSGFLIEDPQWLVFLEGGGWCWDQESCAQRTGIYPTLMSSAKWEPEKALSGIFSTDPLSSPLATANKVYVPYCSSDAWMGNAGADASNGNRHFRGQAIVKAVFSELQRVYGLGLSGQAGLGTKVFFSGCSAGARGALVNLDYVPAMLPRAVEVRGIFDSGMWLDLEPFPKSTLTPLTEQARQVLGFHKAHGRLGNKCAAKYAGGEEWKCLLGQYRLPLLDNPFFASESQYDSFQLFWALGGRSPPYAWEAQLYAEKFRRAMRVAMKSVSTAPRSGVYSSACFGHCVTLSQEFWTNSVTTLYAGQVTFSESLSEWLDREETRVFDMDDCRGFNCGCSAAKASTSGLTTRSSTRRTLGNHR